MKRAMKAILIKKKKKAVRAEFGLWILQEGTLEREANLEEHGSHVRREKVGRGGGGG